MNKTRIDFQVAAFHKKPPKWIIHECSICNCKCGFVFDSNHERVGYDSGCDCVRQSNVNECSWDKVAEFYNIQTNPELIKEMNEFWGFTDG